MKQSNPIVVKESAYKAERLAEVRHIQDVIDAEILKHRNPSIKRYQYPAIAGFPSGEGLPIGAPQGIQNGVHWIAHLIREGSPIASIGIDCGAVEHPLCDDYLRGEVLMKIRELEALVAA